MRLNRLGHSLPERHRELTVGQQLLDRGHRRLSAVSRVPGAEIRIRKLSRRAAAVALSWIEVVRVRRRPILKSGGLTRDKGCSRTILGVGRDLLTVFVESALRRLRRMVIARSGAILVKLALQSRIDFGHELLAGQVLARAFIVPAVYCADSALHAS